MVGAVAAKQPEAACWAVGGGNAEPLEDGRHDTLCVIEVETVGGRLAPAGLARTARERAEDRPLMGQVGFDGQVFEANFEETKRAVVVAAVGAVGLQEAGAKARPKIGVLGRDRVDDAER